MGTPSNLTASLTDEQRHSIGDLREADLEPKEKVRRAFEMLPDPLLTFPEIAELLPAKTKAKQALGEAVEELVADGFLEKGQGTSKPFAASEPVYRKRDVQLGRLRVLAMETELRATMEDEPQGTGSRYQFSIEGRLIRAIAKVDRLLVVDATDSQGTQREEIRRHVDAIRQGVESGTEIDNAILLAVPSDAVSIDPSEGESIDDDVIIFRGKSPWTPKSIAGFNGEPVELQRVRIVEIEFPFRNALFDSEKSAILVDGQQRTAGILLSDPTRRPKVSVSVNLIVGDENRAKSSFLVSNSTVPIKKDLLEALVADLNTKFVPGNLTKTELPARIVKSLALEPGEFQGIVAWAGHHNEKKPRIVYRTMREVVDLFLSSPALKDASDAGDLKAVKVVIDAAFGEVRRVWPIAWELPPKESRLMHGGGLVVLGEYLADILKTMPKGPKDIPAYRQAVGKKLDKLKPRIAWSQAEFDTATADAKEFYRLYLDGLENTGKSIKEFKKWFNFTVYQANQD